MDIDTAALDQPGDEGCPRSKIPKGGVGVFVERRHSIGHGRCVPGLCTGRPHFSEIMGLSRNVAQERTGRPSTKTLILLAFLIRPATRCVPFLCPAGKPASFPANEARPGAGITLTCGWIMWRLPLTRSSQGIASGCPDRHQASTPRNFLEKLIVVSAAERAASYFGRAVQLVKVWRLETRIHASGEIQS